MVDITNKIALLTALSFLFLIALFQPAQSTNLATADIRLTTLGNEPVSLNSVIANGMHADKLTLVMVWATDCPPCEEQKPMIQQFHADYSASVATVVGIAIDGLKDIDEVNRLIAVNAPTYPNFLAKPDTFLTDFEAATAKEFTGAPSYIMFNAQGQALAVAIGPVTKEQLEGALNP